MHDVNHAMAVFREITGVANADFEGGNDIEFLFAESLTTHLVRLDDALLECFAEIGDATLLSPEELRAYLAANYLGNGSGGGRIALDPDGDTLVLGERFEVTRLDAGEFERRLIAFFDRAAQLAKAGPPAGVAPAEPTRAEPVADEFIIRG